MPETHTNQTHTNVRQGQRNGGNGGGAQPQAEPGTQQQARSVTRQESTERKAGALTRQGSRQLASASQSPFAVMRQLSREMDRLMDSFFDRGFGSILRDTGGRDDDWESASLWAPQIDVQQRNDAIVVRADLPGVQKDDVQIEVDEGTLVISGQRREEREEGTEDQGYRMFERSYGSFYRTVALPQGTNPEEIKAEMRDGVLKVTLPVPENARRRRIQIQS